MKCFVWNIICIILIYVSGGTDAFTLINLRQTLSVTSNSRRNVGALFLNVPRLDLPDVVTDKLTGFDLKNPNIMNEVEYRSYAGSAIAGTLLFFTVPGALLTGLYSNLDSVAIAVVVDFLVSALIGGGALIYLSLRNDSIGEKVREVGLKLLTTLKDTTGIATPRYDIPNAITDVMTGQLNLLNPNSMNDKDYDGYSGAAIFGTLGFFLLPGAIITNAAQILGGFAGPAIADFSFSALIGGGVSIYLSLRDDEIGAAVNKAGSKLLDVIDDVVGGNDKLPNGKGD